MVGTFCRRVFLSGSNNVRCSSSKFLLKDKSATFGRGLPRGQSGELGSEPQTGSSTPGDFASCTRHSSLMSSCSENCMRWWDHQDWNCLSNEKMRFHVVAGEDFRSCLRVPQEFGSYLRKINSDTIKLNAPNGCTYDIGVSREMGQMVLRSSWDVFAGAHNLEENDHLVFKFCGSSSIKVDIYSSCGGSQKIYGVNPDPEILEDVSPHTTSDHHVPNGNGIPHPGHVQAPAGFDYFTSGGCSLTKVQHKKVLEMARTIKSGIPLYVAVMNKSNVDLSGCSIRIPSILMEDVREEVFKATVKLEAPDGNVYSVSATQQCNDEIVLQFGWDAFVDAHHVQECDLIIFRHKGFSRLEVFILDPSGHQKTTSWFGMQDVSNTQETCDDSVEIVEPPQKTVEIIDLSSSSDDENNVAAYNAKSARHLKQQLDHFAQGRRMASASCISIKPELDRCPLDYNNSEGPTGSPYIISSKATLLRAQEKMVLEKVQAIRSRFPIYVAVMNRNSTGKDMSMYFAREYSRKCLPSATQDLTLQLADCRGKEWHTLLHVWGGRSRPGDLRRISRGWAQFVRDNHLTLGDICLFELVKATSRLRMKVHLIRKAEKAGAEWTHCSSCSVH